MKIIYLTDIHDALKELKILLSTTQADLYFLSGDILYKAFYDEEKIYQFVCIQEEFYTIANSIGKKIYPMDLATEIIRFPGNYKEYDYDGELSQKAQDYRRLFELATRTMKEKYDLIEEIIVKYSHAPTLLLPGNYDIDLRYTSLRERDMHRRVIEVMGVRIAGYGGAPIATSGIPEKLSVRYHEDKKSVPFYSEPESWFRESRPDILLLHNPAYGFFDKIPGLGHVGGLGVRNYLDDFSPSLVLSGHVHEDYGVAYRNKTIFVNPSNFGGVDSVVGWQAGGSYASIEMQDKLVKNVIFNYMIDKTHHKLQTITLDKKRLKRNLANYVEGCNLDTSKFLRDKNGNAIGN